MSDRENYYQIAVWGENFFNNQYTTQIIPVFAAAFGTPYVKLDKPALWGVDIYSCY